MSIAVDRTDRDRVAICYGATSGSSAGHIFLSTNGGNNWTDISGDIPDISINAIVFDPNNASTLYVGTDVGVFRTINGGTNWQAFDNGIPNVVITDLVLDPSVNMMYTSTFGRGMYKLNITPALTVPEVDLYLRDDVLDTGERFPSPSNLPDPLDPTHQAYWWESPDIKVDAPPYFAAPAVFDGVNFDVDLAHEDAVRNVANRLYLQVHNRGWRTTTNVSVRAFFADASAGLPSLPNALVAPNFNLTSTVNWQPVGPAQIIPTLESNRPVIVSWDWTVPATAATHSCLLAVVSSADDPITTALTDVNVLVDTEKHVCLKNLHVIGPSPAPLQTLVTINFNNAKDHADMIDIVIDPGRFQGGTIGMVLEPLDLDPNRKALVGVQTYTLREGEDIGQFHVNRKSRDVEHQHYENLLDKLDRSVLYDFDTTKVSEIQGVKLAPQQRLQAIITCKGANDVEPGEAQRFSVLQRQGGQIIGGSTYEVRLARAAGLHPVSHIRVTIEMLMIEPILIGHGKELAALISFNDDHCRRHFHPLRLRTGKKVEVCFFDGYVAEEDNMEIALVPIEDERNELVVGRKLYARRFEAPPESWVGEYESEQEPNTRGRQKKELGRLGVNFRYRIESLALGSAAPETD